MQFALFFASTVIKIIKYAILVRILISWVAPHGSNGRIYRIIHDITEPLLSLFRKILPRTGMLDFSPLIAFFVLDFIDYGLSGITSA